MARDESTEKAAEPIELYTPYIVTDEPVEETRGERAYFQFEEYAKTFARIIAAKRTRTPLTIGVHGDWGTGKTTLMKAIEEQLRDTQVLAGRRRKGAALPPFLNPGEDVGPYRPCRTVWFNAWKYSSQETLFVALIEAILSQMRRDGFIHELHAELARPDRPKMKVAEAVIGTLSQVFTLGQIEIDLTKFQTESRFKTHMAFLDEFQEVFDRLLRWYVVRDWKDAREVDDQKGVLVVFVDDLDRCLPDKTVQVLETIKLMMGKPGTIFVLGASRRVVQAAVQAYYQVQKFEDISSQDYLDKIVQLRFDLPPVRPERMGEFIGQFRQWDEGDPLLANLSLVTEGVTTNPRRIKTFINYLELHWGLLVNSEQVTPAEREQFVIWMVLADVEPKLVTHLRDLRSDEERAACLNRLIGQGDIEKGGLRAAAADELLRTLVENVRLQRVLEDLRGRAFAFDADTLGRFIHLSTPPRVQAPPEEEPEEEAVAAEEAAPAPRETRRRRLEDKKARLRAEGMLPEDPQALAALVADPKASLAYRVAASEELARLGDPRPGVGISPPLQGEGLGEGSLPALQWCLVGPGAFMMGSRKEDDPEADDGEMPQHVYDVRGPYWIARYPVTNAQFRAFVDDPQGYRGDGWWTRAGLKWRADRTGPEMAGGVYDLPNYPAVTLTWYEAVAWCRWLTARMQAAGCMPEGWAARLPSEAEWEKAARGGLEIPDAPLIAPSLPPDGGELEGGRISNPNPARRYPWGNEADPNRANYDDSGIGATCAVGIFPGGASPYGCLDLSGNVWEWCATRWVDSYGDYDEKEDNRLEVDAARVLRGGAFGSDVGYVRCAFRYGGYPDLRYYHVGFRVVASPVDSDL